MEQGKTIQQTLAQLEAAPETVIPLEQCLRFPGIAEDIDATDPCWQPWPEAYWTIRESFYWPVALESEHVLPVQWGSSPEWWTPERRLVCAIFVQALDSFFDTLSPWHRTTPAGIEIRAWFASDDIGPVFAFRNVADYLAFDPQRLRRHLHAWTMDPHVRAWWSDVRSYGAGRRSRFLEAFQTALALAPAQHAPRPENASCAASLEVISPLIHPPMPVLEPLPTHVPVPFGQPFIVMIPRHAMPVRVSSPDLATMPMASCPLGDFRCSLAMLCPRHAQQMAGRLRSA